MPKKIRELKASLLKAGGPRVGNRSKPPAIGVRYSMLIRWSDDDETFIVTLPEFENATTDAPTYESAARQGRLLIESFILWYEQDGRPLPQPVLFQPSQQKAIVQKPRLAMAN